MLNVSQLFIYPIKSCKGIMVRGAQIALWGFENDHRFMLVGEDGAHISQRECPTLCLVEPSFLEGLLTVRAPGMNSVVLKLMPGVGEERRVTVHGDGMTSFDQGDDAAAWFSEFVRRKCRLVWAHKNHMRQRKVSVLGSSLTTVQSLAFQDSSPLHVLTSASLHGLEERSGLGNCLDRFRPNIVIDGSRLAENDEDTWAHQYVCGGAGCITRLTTRKKTVRCGIPAINQQTGEKQKEPLGSLAGYRKDGGQVFFGAYVIPTVFNPLQSIMVGDEVRVERA